MPDFSSSLYLGFRHPSWCLRPWASLTLGAPAALHPPPGERDVAARIATLVGQDAALLGTSTLHLMWDLAALLADARCALVVDAWLYPVGSWGVERAESRGVPVRRFRHRQAEDAAAAVRWARRIGRRPVVVSDGFCPACGAAAPLDAYLDLLAPADGLLVVDDTQALGVLGADAADAPPYGLRGAGTLAWLGREGAPAIVVASLAKGFGAPLAAAAGPLGWIRRVADRSDTRLYASPPSVAAIAAAAAALELNGAVGDALRARLAALVGRFRARLRCAGIAPAGGLFPVQEIPLGRTEARRVHAALLAREVATVLQRTHGARTASLGVVLTAAHDSSDVDCATDAIAAVLGGTTRRTRCGSREMVTT